MYNEGHTAVDSPSDGVAGDDNLLRNLVDQIRLATLVDRVVGVDVDGSSGGDVHEDEVGTGPFVPVGVQAHRTDERSHSNLPTPILRVGCCEEHLNCRVRAGDLDGGH